MLVPDEGFDGLVIKIEIQGVERQGTTLIAGAGESWDALVERAVAEDLWGVENLSGIPGTVGGAVVQNIGAYGAALSEVVEWVEVYDRQDEHVLTFSADECGFGYRDSVFKRTDRYVAVRVALQLYPDGAPNASYKDLSDIDGCSLPQIRQKVFGIRAQKFPDLSQEGTAGSFFKNPILLPDEAGQLSHTYPDMPLFTMPETAGTKVPLAWLLDHILGLKGYSIGGARLYERQPLVIVAKRGASSHDVEALAQFVEKKVKEIFFIELEREVRVIV